MTSFDIMLAILNITDVLVNFYESNWEHVVELLLWCWMTSKG